MPVFSVAGPPSSVCILSVFKGLFGRLFRPSHCSQEGEGGRGVSIVGQRHPDTDQTGAKVANGFDVDIVPAPCCTSRCFLDAPILEGLQVSGRICRCLQMEPGTCSQIQRPAARFQTPADGPQTPPTCIQTETNPTQTPRNSPRHPPDARPDRRSTGRDRQTPRKHPKFGVHSAFAWDPLWPQRGGVWRCLQVSGGVWPDTPSGQGLTIVVCDTPRALGCAPGTGRDLTPNSVHPGQPARRGK